MVFGQKPEMFKNSRLEAPKTRYTLQTEKCLARNENQPFWGARNASKQAPGGCKNQIFGPD